MKKETKKIIELLQENEGQIFNRTEITSILGLEIDGPTFRKLIQKQREDNKLVGYILADHRGYWYSEKKEELIQYRNILMARRSSLSKQLKGLVIE